MLAPGSRRSSLRLARSTAFAPSVITNFFAIDFGTGGSPVGATGGGYILSKGTVTTVRSTPLGSGSLLTAVNGDRSYDARTTRRAVKLLLAGVKLEEADMKITQRVDTPIGSGFGASAAAATSAVYAAASSMRISLKKEELAIFAHRAEILEQTGLGSVSVVYDQVGAGAITVAGEPGKAEFVKVRVPKDCRLVTAYLAPYDKKDALSSAKMLTKINELGKKSLEKFLTDRSFENLAGEGEKFSKNLGLESPEVKKMIATAKQAGAEHASQNMIGYSVHAVCREDTARNVSSALKNLSTELRVDTFEVGRVRAGVTAPNRR